MLLTTLFALALPTSASAGALPARRLELLPCTADAQAACWEEADVLSRFAAPTGTLLPPVEVDVRLAWSPEGLLLRARDLPEHAVLELRLDSARGESARTAQGVQLGEGVHQTGWRVEAGELRSARVQLVVRDSAESPSGSTLTWSPNGTADLHRTFPLAVLEDRADPVEIELQETDHGLAILSPGASLRVQWFEPERGFRYRGTPAPLDLAGESIVALPTVTQAGWYRITATRTGDGGAPEALGAWLVHRSPPPVGQLAAHGIHPPPLLAEEAAGRPFRIRRGARIVVQSPEAESAAAWLSAELTRTLGRSLPVSTDAPLPGDVVLAPLGEPADLLGPARALVERDEGYALSLQAGGARVVATDRRGWMWGAVALSQALFAQRQAPREATALRVADAPALPLRVLYHSANIAGRMKLTVEDYARFIDKAVVPGRYNTLVLSLNDRVQWESHPELADRMALSKDDWRSLIAHAESRGIEVLPSLNAPSHADWITSHRGELMEGTNPKLLCTRHPETWSLLADLYTEALELFGEPRAVHIAHDEHAWRFERAPADERCPRCSGSLPAVLLAEDLRWHLDFFGERDTEVIAWSDQLVAGHNGAKEGSHQALELLTEQERSALTLMSWARLGDTVSTLGERGGLQVIRAHTAYSDAKRAGLPGDLPHIVGEGLAVFVPAPWSTLSFAPGTRPLGYHLGSIVLAGATAWRPELAERGAIAPSLLALSEHPAYRPGLFLPEDFQGRTRRLVLTGGEAGVAIPETSWSRSAGSDGVMVGQPAVASLDHPVRVEVNAKVRGASLLQAAVLSWEAERAIRDSQAKTRLPGGRPVAELRVTFADGSVGTIPWRLGLDTERLAWDPRATLLWHTAGSVALASPQLEEVDPGATDRRLYRWDWVNAAPPAEVATLELVVLEPGVQIVIGGAAALVR